MVGLKAFDNVRIYDAAASMLFILYFCDEAVASVLYRLVGGALVDPVFNTIFLCLALVCAANASFRRLLPSFACYGIIFVAIAATIVAHPEYNEWFFGVRYGLSAQFLTLRGAIWAFLVVSLVSDRMKLFRCMTAVAWIMLAYQSIRFADSTMNGYWIDVDQWGNQIQKSYGLYFGYEVLFPTCLFGARAILMKTRWCFVPFVYGLALIMLGGSRGSFVFAAAFIVVALAFRWRMATVRWRLAMGLVGLFAIAAIACDLPAQLASGIVGGLGIESRTLASIVGNSFSDGSGREDIYRMALGLIGDGSLFGHGVYGDRTTIGRWFTWGYSHNFFLEVFVSFGLVGGTVLSLLFIVAVIRTFLRCTEPRDAVIFCVLFTCSLKLMISDSFWYYPQFWALLAFMVLWRQQTPETELSFAPGRTLSVGEENASQCRGSRNACSGTVLEQRA